jgi:hypothetical protein
MADSVPPGQLVQRAGLGVGNGLIASYLYLLLLSSSIAGSVGYGYMKKYTDPTVMAATSVVLKTMITQWIIFGIITVLTITTGIFWLIPFFGLHYLFVFSMFLVVIANFTIGGIYLYAAAVVKAQADSDVPFKWLLSVGLLLVLSSIIVIIYLIASLRSYSKAGGLTADIQMLPQLVVAPEAITAQVAQQYLPQLDAQGIPIFQSRRPIKQK